MTTKATRTRQPAPKTAYDLLARVARHIVEEPKRYVQAMWLLRGSKEIKNNGFAMPACGTVGCRGGWIVLLHDGIKSPIPYDRVYIRAQRILDMTSYELESFFSFDAVTGKPGTLAYAKRGAAGIRAFMKQHEAHLKGRLLKDVQSGDIK